MIRAGITYDEYAAGPAYRWSQINKLDTSPLACDYSRRHPDNGDTADRQWLRAVHALTLEPDTARVIAYDGTRRGKAWDEFEASHPGYDILPVAQYDAACYAASAVRRHELVAPFLDDAETEVSIDWTEDVLTPSGVVVAIDMMARADALCHGRSVVLDLKTLGTVHERQVGARAGGLGYHGQLAHYDAGLTANGCQIARHMLVVSDGKPPWDVSIFELSPESPDGALHVGREYRAGLLRRLAECIDLDQWPGRHLTIQDLVLPHYLLGDGEIVAGDDDAGEMP